MKETQVRLKELTGAMQKVLLEKNRRYGDSALNPLGVFSPLTAVDAIRIRLDDKLKRIKNGPPVPRTNDVCDLIGYCFLLLAANNVEPEEILALID